MILTIICFCFYLNYLFVYSVMVIKLGLTKNTLYRFNKDTRIYILNTASSKKITV